MLSQNIKSFALVFNFLKHFGWVLIFQKQLTKEEKFEYFTDNNNKGKQHCSLARADSKVSSKIDPVVIPKEL